MQAIAAFALAATSGREVGRDLRCPGHTHGADGSATACEASAISLAVATAFTGPNGAGPRACSAQVHTRSQGSRRLASKGATQPPGQTPHAASAQRSISRQQWQQYLAPGGCCADSRQFQYRGCGNSDGSGHSRRSRRGSSGRGRGSGARSSGFVVCGFDCANPCNERRCRRSIFLAGLMQMSGCGSGKQRCDPMHRRCARTAWQHNRRRDGNASCRSCGRRFSRAAWSCSPGPRISCGPWWW